MEIRAVICDDNHFILEQMKKILMKYAENEEVSVKCRCYNNSIQMLKEIGTDFDIIFVDIDMPEMNGFDVASTLKKEINTYYELAFITAYENYVFEAIKYKPFRYIRKSNLEYETIEAIEAIEKILRNIEAEKNMSGKKILFNDYRITDQVFLKEIIYCEIIERKIKVVLEKYNIKDIRMSMKELFSQLEKYNFAIINKGCIVNVEYVEKIERNQVYMSNGDILYLSRTRKESFKNQLLNYWGLRV